MRRIESEARRRAVGGDSTAGTSDARATSGGVTTTNTAAATICGCAATLFATVASGLRSGFAQFVSLQHAGCDANDTARGP